MRFYAIFWALCLPLFCLAQTEIPTPVSQETSVPSEETLKLTFIGFLSYDSVLTVMPQRSIVEKQLETLTAQYEAE